MSNQESPLPPLDYVQTDAELLKSGRATIALNSRRFEYVAIDDIKPNPHYAREPNRAQRRKLKASYRKFGENAPLLVDRNLMIVAGVQRLAALKELGHTHVWVLFLDHLTETQARAYALADNRIAEDSDWNRKKLGIELKTLDRIAVDFELGDLGFDVPEAGLAIHFSEDRDVDDDEFEQPIGPPVSAIGDLWHLGPHCILCADALEPAAYARLLSGEKATAAITDPPYNVPIAGHVSGKGKVQHREFPMATGEMSEGEFTDFQTSALTNICRHTLSGAVVYVFMDWRHITETIASGEASGCELLNICVWVKSNAGMGSFYRSQHELVFVFRNGPEQHENNVQLGRFGRNRTNVWHYPAANAFARRGSQRGTEIHPTVKPIPMVADAILDCTSRGDIVLDPFLGSGTTLLAAERTGRRCFGIELDPLYVDTAIERWQRMTGCKALSPFGETFEFIKAKREAES